MVQGFERLQSSVCNTMYSQILVYTFLESLTHFYRSHQNLHINSVEFLLHICLCFLSNSFSLFTFSLPHYIFQLRMNWQIAVKIFQLEVGGGIILSYNFVPPLLP
jgi:hypothetical protein